MRPSAIGDRSAQIRSNIQTLKTSGVGSAAGCSTRPTVHNCCSGNTTHKHGHVQRQPDESNGRALDVYLNLAQRARNDGRYCTYCSLSSSAAFQPRTCGCLWRMRCPRLPERVLENRCRDCLASLSGSMSHDGRSASGCMVAPDRWEQPRCGRKPRKTEKHERADCHPRGSSTEAFGFWINGTFHITCTLCVFPRPATYRELHIIPQGRLLRNARHAFAQHGVGRCLRAPPNRSTGRRDPAVSCVAVHDT